jgi:hypothetical protein
VQQTLPPTALQLFQRMPVDAQRHSLNVLEVLYQQGHTEPALLQAALLHDVGKVAADESGVRIGLWLRGPLVLLETFAPHRLHDMASPRPKARWRYAIHVHIMHPQIGATWAADAGCSELTCWLIAHHQEVLPPQDGQNITPTTADARRLAWLAALQAADNAN